MMEVRLIISGRLFFTPPTDRLPMTRQNLPRHALTLLCLRENPPFEAQKL
jgi:hypothetical protein